MRGTRSLATLFLACAMVITACGDDDTTATTATTPETTTTQPATTTAVRPEGFTAADLAAAVLHDGDPWVVPVSGVAGFDLTLDDIWPIEEFAAQRAVYVEAGFEAGYFAAFGEDDGLVITAAHLFTDAAGAGAAMDLIEESFNDLELVAQITDLAPGSLSNAELLDVADLGDRATGVMLTGPEFQVVGIIWITGNLLQFVRNGMALGDAERTAASFDLATAMADRMVGG